MFGPGQLSLFAHARRFVADTKLSTDKMDIQEMLSDRASMNSEADEHFQARSGELPVKSSESTKTDTARKRFRQRHQSLHVNWTEADVTRLAQEVYDETIAEVHLSLFGFWIREQEEHYSMAKLYIRELGLDQVCLNLLL